MNKFQEFLKKNIITPSSALPIVHTTSAYCLDDIMTAKEISSRECNVFIGESLNYFFYGKPSYRVNSGGKEAAEWQLPVCFVIEFDAIKSIKRIFPFDTGAFSNERHPPYITMMGMDKFDAGVSREAPSRIIGAFFSTVADLFKLEPKEKTPFMNEFSLSVRDAEILALQKLAGDKSHDGLDDRRFCVEIQTEDNVSLTEGATIAVILPEEYLEDGEIKDFVTKQLKAVPISYCITSMSSETMTAVVYQKLLEFYKGRGIV